MTGRAILQTITSATWLYPFKGIIFFASHPAYYPLLSSRLIPVVFLSLFIYSLLFTFAYLPQVAFLALYRGAGMWVNAIFLVLGEGLAIVSLLFEAFFVDETLVDVFDAVLIQEGLEDLVEPARVLNNNEPEPVKRLGKPTLAAVYSPFSLRQIIEFIFFLPFNFVPYIGVPVFLFVTGYRAGPFHHWRYFKLLGFSRSDRAEFIKRRQIKYTLFGTVSLLLQLVPGLSMVFLLTSAAGSALWASKIEKAKRAREAAQDQGRPEPEFHDDPI